MPVQHIALFQFQAGTSEEFIQQTVNELRRLARVIPGITSFSIGMNNSPEGLADGLTHGFVMTFLNASSRDAYLVHPEHEKFKAFAIPAIQKVVVFDYDS
jgi:hypothetical protein